MQNDLGKMLEQLKGMQDQMARVQNELAKVTTTAESGGGMVKVTANGKQEIVSIKIDKEVIAPEEQEMLEDLVVAAVNRALAQAKELSDSKMDEATKPFMPNLPGFPPFQ